MKLELKYMDKRNWKRILKCTYKAIEIIENNKKGIVSLLKVLELTEPSYKKYDSVGEIKIVDKNYYWLQIAFEASNYWITAMFDENQKIIQYYIDITQNNILKNPKDARFYDLYLDIVKLDSGEIFILDEDELQEALNNKIIDQNEYNLAYKTLDYLKEIISNPDNEIEKMCDKYFNILSDIIK